ncbi:glutathione S-transferase family protein [Acinetobacter sp. ME22]|uniref:glutathione S-transferase family protein n=1 Tax=Acinetobacter sp. ME22 TaxID=2904802 RepID=UPI001ED9D41D|nr:glutathione S-transferase family protein [Acinetobacter sp. ME22]MCG2572603.1 glutathione S-transferase family protein [Acinetobacter sp. ME22]
MYTLWIGNKNYSSWSLRAWLSLRALEIPFEEQLSTLNLGSSSYLKFKAFSPSGKVPCLVDGEHVVWDSLAIIEYVAEQYPVLFPQDKTARTWARCAMAEMHSGFIELRSRCPMNCSLTGIEIEHTPALVHDIQRLDELLQQGLTQFGGAWLAGEKFTAVDAFFAPVALRARSYSLKFSDSVQQWMQQILQHPALQEWCQQGEQEDF